MAIVTIPALARVGRIPRFGAELGREPAELVVTAVGGEKRSGVNAREREQHVVHERDRRRGPLDVEEDGAAVEYDHSRVPPLPAPCPASCAGPMHSGW